MQQVAELYSLQHAQIFADYCVSVGWEVSLVTEQPQHVLLYCADAHVDDVLQALAEFAADPDAEKYQAAAWQYGDTSSPTTHWGIAPIWRQMRASAGVVTQWTAFLCIAVFLAQQIWPQTLYLALKYFSPSQWIDAGLDWRWFSPVLLHFSAAHLVFNVLAWWIFAGRVETQLGSRRLLLILFVAAFISNYAQFFFADAHFGGLSGVVYAILGFVWIYGWRFPKQNVQLNRWDIGLALVFLVLGFFDLLWVNMANWAHLFGLLTGVVLALLQPKPASRQGGNSAAPIQLDD